jgi:TolA-binding protein
MKGDFDELSARARRGELSSSERRQLRMLLDSSLEAQLAHRAGCEFDAGDSVLPGDDALAERVARRLLVQVPRAPVRHRRIGWKLAFAGVLTVAAAAAGPQVAEHWGIRLLSMTKKADVVETVSQAPEQDAARRGPGASAAVMAASVTAVPSSESPANRSLALVVSPPSVATSVPPRAVPRDTPASVYAEANQARRHGHVAQATEFYQDLQRRYPASAEAYAADIALGMLYAGRSPSLALVHFERYLKRGGPLGPEALWGQAQALGDLGRTQEAREAYQMLLERYPQSTYANTARARLGHVP